MGLEQVDSLPEREYKTPVRVVRDVEPKPIRKCMICEHKLEGGQVFVCSSIKCGNEFNRLMKGEIG